MGRRRAAATTDLREGSGMAGFVDEAVAVVVNASQIWSASRLMFPSAASHFSAMATPDASSQPVRTASGSLYPSPSRSVVQAPASRPAALSSRPVLRGRASQASRARSGNTGTELTRLHLGTASASSVAGRRSAKLLAREQSRKPLGPLRVYARTGLRGGVRHDDSRTHLAASTHDAGIFRMIPWNIRYRFI